MRVYLDNNLLTYLLSYEEGRVRPDLEAETKALVALLSRPEIEALYSDEILAEVEKLRSGSRKERLQALYSRLKAGRPVTRNARAGWDDGVTRWDSPDWGWDHPYDDGDRDEIVSFFQEKGLRADEYDVRYLANAKLPENRIDVFLTADRKTIWNFRDGLRDRFGIVVKLPSELLGDLDDD